MSISVLESLTTGQSIGFDAQNGLSNRICALSVLQLAAMKQFPKVAGGLAILLLTVIGRAQPLVLDPGAFEHYVHEFNQQDEELYSQAIPNSKGWEFLRENIPWFDCPDADLVTIYYFRWWTYRKHIERSPEGFVITEFLPPVPWAGKYNSISCAAGHHFYEGRWLHDPRYLNDYAAFWFRRGGDPRRYSFWAADALWAKALVDGNSSLPESLLDDLVANYEAWEKDHFDASTGLFHQTDDRDGMEVSVGGSGYRPTINSYMYGDAMAITQIAKRAGKTEIANRFSSRAQALRQAVLERLWDSNANFFKVLPSGPGASLASARELHGYTPWYFHLAEASSSAAWREFADPQGFNAPYGLTTVERRSSAFTLSYQGHECQWNGPSWPYATSIALTALANLLNGPGQSFIGKEDYFEALKTYANAQHLRRSDGRVTPWIDENLNPMTGEWLSRTRLKTWKAGTWSAEKGGRERGKDYNHSTFCDLIISGLVGLRPRSDDAVEVNPLIPDEKWDWFCLDDVAYHGRRLTILWDRSGAHYRHGAGLQIFADEKPIAFANNLERISGTLSDRAGSKPANRLGIGH